MRPVQVRLPPLFALVALLSSVGLGQTAAPGSTGTSMTDEIASVVKSFRGRMAVAAIDLRTSATIEIDADTRFPTASTIKTAVMVEAWQQAVDGRLSMDTRITLRDANKVGGSGVLRGLGEGLSLSVADLIHLMIVLSDNTATNMLIDRVGTARVNARLEAYGLVDTKLFRPTFRDGRPDVLPDLEREFGLGMTTPRDMAKLMALIAQGKAVNKEASDAMLATLRRQQDRAMIPRHLPGDVQVGNKTGTDEEKHAGSDGVKRHVRADAAIITGPNVSYVVAIYARQIEDTRWSIDNDALVTGARVSRMIFDQFSKAR
ncbi:MAG TPA: serine hydrolase [Vicinamibacterales bacterium]|nr:serine hydrolase [Vicinamibacterales bacterium]